MGAALDPIPNEATIAEPDGTLSRRYYLWLYSLWSRVLSGVAVVGGTQTRANQVASITTSTIYTTTQAGLYRVNYALWVTTLPSTSFSLTVTVTWRNGGITKSQTFAALTGAPGTLATAFQNGSIPIAVDSGVAIALSVAYVSVGAQAMAFSVIPATELIA